MMGLDFDPCDWCQTVECASWDNPYCPYGKYVDPKTGAILKEHPKLGDTNEN